jgi:hypothetical protein
MLSLIIRQKQKKILFIVLPNETKTYIGRKILKLRIFRALWYSGVYRRDKQWALNIRAKSTKFAPLP